MKYVFSAFAMVFVFAVTTAATSATDSTAATTAAVTQVPKGRKLISCEPAHAADYPFNATVDLIQAADGKLYIVTTANLAGGAIPQVFEVDKPAIDGNPLIFSGKNTNPAATSQRVKLTVPDTGKGMVSLQPTPGAELITCKN